MKIITQESFNKNEIEYSLKKDLLIPCFVYKIPIETSKDKSLNFIEKAILKLIQEDDLLKNDIDRLSVLLGFCKQDGNKKCIEDDSDKRKIIKLILQKIKVLQIDETENDNNTEVTIYQFYQEAYTGELLPIITKEINDFSYAENDYSYKKSNNREISFKKDVSSKRLTNAILANGYKKSMTYKPTKADIIKTIYLHNQNKYQGSHIIDYTDFNIEIFESELMYLHTKFYIPRNNIKTFVISNGFTNDFSIFFRKIFEYKHQELLKSLRKETKIDSDKLNSDVILIPFEDDINQYRELKKLIQNIEIASLKMKQDETVLEEVKDSKNILIQSLYDLVEKSFSIFSNELDANKSLQNKKRLKTLAKEFGFNIKYKEHLSIFNVDSRDNLQKYLAKSLIYKKDELYEMAIFFPNLFFSLNNLLDLRNGVKHSDKEKTLEKFNEEDLKKYKNLVYKVLSIVVKIKQKTVSQDEIGDDDKMHRQNAYVDLEEEISIEVMNKLPEEIKDNLTSINFYLASVDFEENKYSVVKEVINTLYSSFELLIRKNVNILVLDEQSVATKDEILEKIRKNVEIGESLYRVSPKMLEFAFQKQGASLGAYVLVYLYNQKNIDKDDVKLIENVISVRGHGSPDMADVEKITLQELKEIKEKSFKYIEKLMEEING